VKVAQSLYFANFGAAAPIFENAQNLAELSSVLVLTVRRGGSGGAGLQDAKNT
jgi:hypothetical protein